ncbi:MAG TPA: ABC transporter permease [Opitutaceae bacterium]|nr:ABC transporter permease [Opitutaceae bacterium]
MIRGFLYHFLLTLRLNFKNRQALIYGYFVPVFFLIAFGTLFRAGDPPLLRQMSQLLTISVLGGACFGLPTALVSERERGLWRRFRLLPGALVPLLASTLLARTILVAGACLLQIVLAHGIYGTPFPQDPWMLAGGFAAVAAAFLGMGLVVAALADDVPAVQALGQCLFLPLIMIGGVGVPLLALPPWAQCLASFFPGRYAVDALQAGYSGEGTAGVLAFNLEALGLFALAAGAAGARLFRWDGAQRMGRPGRLWVAGAVVPWLAVGAFSAATGRWHALGPVNTAAAITGAELNAISFERLPPDDGIFTPIAPPDFAKGLSPADKARLDAIAFNLGTWAPANDPDPSQSIRALLNVAAVADVAEDRLEGPIARTVLNLLFARYRRQDLVHGLAWIALRPGEGEARSSVAEVGVPGRIDPKEVRARSAIYAAKFLGRIRGRIAD